MQGQESRFASLPGAPFTSVKRLRHRMSLANASKRTAFRVLRHFGSALMDLR